MTLQNLFSLVVIAGDLLESSCILSLLSSYRHWTDTAYSFQVINIFLRLFYCTLAVYLFNGLAIRTSLVTAGEQSPGRDATRYPSSTKNNSVWYGLKTKNKKQMHGQMGNKLTRLKTSCYWSFVLCKNRVRKFESSCRGDFCWTQWFLENLPENAVHCFTTVCSSESGEVY